MQITNVVVKPVADEGRLRALAVITIEDIFVIHDIKVIQGDNGLFIAMPSRKCTDGLYRDVCHPINQATRDMLQIIILAKYEEVMQSKEGE